MGYGFLFFIALVAFIIFIIVALFSDFEEKSYQKSINELDSMIRMTGKVYDKFSREIYDKREEAKQKHPDAPITGDYKKKISGGHNYHGSNYSYAWKCANAGESCAYCVHRNSLSDCVGTWSSYDDL